MVHEQAVRCKTMGECLSPPIEIIDTHAVYPALIREVEGRGCSLTKWHSIVSHQRPPWQNEKRDKRKKVAGQSE